MFISYIISFIHGAKQVIFIYDILLIYTKIHSQIYNVSGVEKANRRTRECPSRR